MYRMKDLLLLLMRQNGEELLLEPHQPPRMLLNGTLLVLDEPLLGAEEVQALLWDIVSEEQRRELEACGDARFVYVGEHLARFNVGIQARSTGLHAKIKYLSAG